VSCGTSAGGIYSLGVSGGRIFGSDALSDEAGRRPNTVLNTRFISGSRKSLKRVWSGKRKLDRDEHFECFLLSMKHTSLASSRKVNDNSQRNPSPEDREPGATRILVVETTKKCIDQVAHHILLWNRSVPLAITVSVKLDFSP